MVIDSIILFLQTKGLKVFLFVAGDKEVTSTWVLLKNLYETHGVKALYTGKVKLKEGNVLFNNALNTLYFWLYGVRHMAFVTHVMEHQLQ